MYKDRNCPDAGSIIDGYVVNKSSKGISGHFVTQNAIAPGELPGYTGWARPEKTLARFFSIKSTSKSMKAEGVAGYEYVIVVSCEGHEDCEVKTKNENNDGSKSNANHSNCTSLFFLRAYGPAVIPGTVTSRSCDGGGCCYEFTFVFYDPGLYTIEAVLTVSSSPLLTTFPLRVELNQQEPSYEGYLLPGFPIIENVVFGKEEGPKKTTSISERDVDKDLCTFEHLVETSSTSALEKARWKVVGKVNEKKYSSKTMNSSLVSTIGYANNVNSLGIMMEYQYLNGCLVIPESFFGNHDKRVASSDECSGPRNKIHIVYIGDSVLRVQKDMLQGLLKNVPTQQVELTFLSLHGGYRKNEVLGPANVEKFLKDLQLKNKGCKRFQTGCDDVVILFNTGLHDIHRLCSSEYRDERPSYLDKDRLSSGSFHCVNEYRALLKDFIEKINGFPAALKVFQTTTAAWPKYGNFGIQWSANAQSMILLSDFCEYFNNIAFEVLADYKHSDIQIMDGYWITYS